MMRTEPIKETNMESRFVEKLAELKYVYRDDIRDRKSLEDNFREKFEALNQVQLTDAEFYRLRDEIISSDVFTASKILRNPNTFRREDDSPLHYSLVNVKDWCKNEFEVINQLRMNTENSHHRYDVIILINGIPVVQIELKGHPISPRNAMQQIVDYKNDPGNGYTNSLMCFVQLFIVSNESITHYFANNRKEHFNFNAEERYLPVYQWANDDNKKITNIYNFADKFLTKCTLGEMISRYMVLVESDQKLMIMRPYQIYAVKAIVDCIQQNRGNGYIWHTTGSGKTLTSFKAATLLKDNPDIEKCLFVVDRKDLDKQTREEFNKFQAGCVEENTNTETLVQNMLSEDYSKKVIVTTIQKLGLALDANNRQNYKKRLEPLRKKRIVFIFDECHRSQFGENHKAIKEFFPNAQLFGFTGTPIRVENATNTIIVEQKPVPQTTDYIFQKLLHAYTITHAIEDKNVLRFHIDYYKGERNSNDETGERRAVVDTILQKHDDATHSRRFNAIFATASINDAIAYYRLFKEVQKEREEQDENFSPLNIACVFSPPAEGNPDVKQIQEDLPQEKADNTVAPDEKKAALKEIITDYNTRYKTNHNITEFDGYYQDIQQRIKDQQYPNAEVPHAQKIDVVIVVDMLLTGFDSKYLNTLYVDKNLKYHGLIQAFSRTNRVLNDSKPFGKILDFRGQQDAVDEAIALFSGEEGKQDNAREIWLVDPAPVILAQYETAVKDLEKFMRSHQLDCKPEEVFNLRGDIARAAFINHFKEVQRLKTRLDQYTDLTDEEKAQIEQLLPINNLRSFKSAYLETAKQLKEIQTKAGDKVVPEVQQLDFELVLFASAVIDYDYIMALIAKMTQTAPAKQKMTLEQVINLIRSNANLMDEGDDLEDYFINSLQVGKLGQGFTETEIKAGYQAFKTEKHNRELALIAEKHNLPADALQAFTDLILRRMIFDGELLTDLMQPLGLHWKERAKKEDALMEDLIPHLKKRVNGQIISGLSAYE